MKTNPQILIIEDNPDDEALLMRQLEKAELHEHVRTLRDGSKALDYLTNGHFKNGELLAVFLDLKLPGINGLELLKIIRSKERTRNLPVIVMTSSNSPEDLEKCRKLGVSLFVQKPLTFSSFADAYADTFRARREGRTSTCE